MRIPRFLIVLPFLPYLLSCRASSVAGTDDVQDTGSIAGLIQAADGKPAAATEVVLYPEAHDPYAGKPLPGRWRATTDAAGSFRLDSVPAGRFNLEGADAKGPGRLLLRNVAVGAGAMLMEVNGTLRLPGSFIVPLEADVARAGDYLYLPGTGRFRVIGPEDLEAGQVELDSVPAGSFPELRLEAAGGNRGTNLLASPLTLAPGGKVLVNPALAWNNTRRIVVNTSPSGAGLAGDLVGFPLLVRLTASELDFAQAAGRGEDMRFTRPDGTLLSHETELWDSARGRAEIWVRMDTLRGKDSAQHILMHTGNPMASQASSGTAVFHPSGGYQGAWHLSAIPPVGNSAYPDASGAANHAQPGNGPLAVDGTGPSTGDVRLNGVNQFVFTGKRVPAPQAFTLSLWFRTATRTGGRLISFGDSTLAVESLDTDRFLWISDGGNLHFGVFPDIMPRRVLSTPEAYNDDKWHFAAAVLSDSGQSLFVDGRKVAERKDVRAGDLKRYSGFWSLGHFVKNTVEWPPTPSGNFFQGSLDEARVQTAAMSEDWVRMCFANQRPGGGALAFP